MRSATWMRPTIWALVLLGHAATCWAAPWEPLLGDSWIWAGPPDGRITMTPVNTGVPYEVGFDQAGGGNRARGMNALRFSNGGADTGHLVSDQLAGRFAVTNTGNSRTFADVVLVVAIDAPALPAGFEMALNVVGRTPWPFVASGHFTYYDHPAWDAGRPTGYYSITSPQGEPLAYDFAAGMVTAWVAEGVDLGPGGGSVSLDYAFANLPGRAVFSVYGFDADIGWVYHTNRGLPDAASPTSPVSTFEVVPEPGALALAAVGLAGVVRSRSRRRGTRRE